MKTFKDLGLKEEILTSLEKIGFTEPTEIQAEAIPFVLNSKKDLIALAQTGTGKTAAFSLPILNQLKAGSKKIQAIILCPTRELCLQITNDIKKFTEDSKGVSLTAVYGGSRIDLQKKSLQEGSNIVVGTPGRVHDLIRRGALKLADIKWVVLDEADEMLDMGFKEDLDAILEETPSTRQTMLFSATFSSSVEDIARNYMQNTDQIKVGSKNAGSANVSHEYYVVKGRDRFLALERIIDSLPGVYGILFCRTRHETQEVAEKLKQAGYDTEALHGDIAQSTRTQIMQRFRDKAQGLLVATDVAARGIDVNELTHVINYNLPDQNESYTHRSGRTGRAQKTGVSISIVGPREVRRIKQIEKNIGREFIHKKVPTFSEVFQKQAEYLVESIKSVDIEKIGQEKFFAQIANDFKKITKEDLVKYFIAHQMGRFLQSKSAERNLDASPDFSGGKDKDRLQDPVVLKINFGKKHGFNLKKLFSLINSDRALKGIEIGQIELQGEESFFSVESEIADQVITLLKTKNIGGLSIHITKSKKQLEAKSSSRSRGSSRGYRSGRGRSSGGRNHRGGGNSRNSRGGRGRR